MNISMIGSGAWGTAIGHVLLNNGHSVSYVPRSVNGWPQEQKPDFIFVALPCQVLRARIHQLQPPCVPVVSLTKGIEIGTGERVSQILREVLPQHPIGVVSGPSLAQEVEAQAPTAVVAASEDEELAKKIQEVLHQKLFRVYRSQDMAGVEIGGALKNIYAIAGGICEGLKIGENGMAGLLTRSLAEMVRIGCVMGAKKETLFGLSGMGDLMLTAYSGLSRNHQVGEALAHGLDTASALQKVKGIAEGVPTTEAVYKIVQKLEIKAPVLVEVHRVLYEHKSAQSAFHDLMLRQVEQE